MCGIEGFVLIVRVLLDRVVVMILALLLLLGRRPCIGCLCLKVVYKSAQNSRSLGVDMVRYSSVRCVKV